MLHSLLSKAKYTEKKSNQIKNEKTKQKYKQIITNHYINTSNSWNRAKAVQQKHSSFQYIYRLSYSLATGTRIASTRNAVFPFYCKSLVLYESEICSVFFFEVFQIPSPSSNSIIRFRPISCPDITKRHFFWALHSIIWVYQQKKLSAFILMKQGINN